MPSKQAHKGFLERFEAEWKAFQAQGNSKVNSTREFIKKYPFLALGLAFLLGYFLASMKKRR